MSAEVIPFRGRLKPARTRTECGCCEHHVCYSHRLAAAWQELSALPEVLEGDAWVFRADVRRLSAGPLAELAAIVREVIGDDALTDLPTDERTTR